MSWRRLDNRTKRITIEMFFHVGIPIIFTPKPPRYFNAADLT